MRQRCQTLLREETQMLRPRLLASALALATSVVLTLTGFALAAVDVWRSSRGPEAGTILSLVIDPRNPKTVYAGTEGDGAGGTVFKSIDGGWSWHPASAGLV